MAAIEQVYSPEADDKSTKVDDHDDDEYFNIKCEHHIMCALMIGLTVCQTDRPIVADSPMR